MLDRIKTALRISHNKLDAEITATISAARSEMVRVGINADMANSNTDPLILMAIKTYCLAQLHDDPDERERQNVSWLYQLDCLRKSVTYSAE